MSVNSLCKQLKDELAMKDQLDSFDMLISLAIRLVNRMWDWC